MPLRRDELSADILGERCLPQSRESEMALLGGLILKNEEFKDVQSYIKKEVFAYPAHQTIFEAYVALMERKIDVDLVLLANELRTNQRLEEVGGAEYLAALVEQVPTAKNTQEYAKIVYDKHVIRKVVEACSATIHQATQVTEDPSQIVAAAYKRIQDCTQLIADGRAISVGDTIESTINRITNISPDKPAYLSTGISSLDEALGGLHRGFYIIGGRAKMGKTSLAMNILEYLALDKKIPAAIITLESSRDVIEEDFVYSRARVDSKKGRMGRFEREEIKRLRDAGEEIKGDCPLYIEGARTPNEVIAVARRLYHNKGIKLLVTDYIQRAVSNTEREMQEIAQFSKNLCDLAQKELNIPLLALSQVVKEVDKREDKHPKIGDLYGPGSSAHDADGILLIYRPDFYEPNSLEKGTAHIDILQRRGGITRQILKWEDTYRRFSNQENAK